ncbi:CapA family protein [Mesorhizobium sp. AR02]|uniref:CapA family protein n=1 Tax=Mesorhizobium sp. AR02 TaxID=2865837 RepID=UPI00215F3B69|nr:CapA family protein [Mesorhizobium sp. AR02]UVK50442.1 CapA family protein [Mesorhizobium sp. AR02]
MSVMRRHLPVSMFDAFKPESPLIGVAAKCALLVNYWDRPYADAATDAAEIEFFDDVYWWYKSVRPITKPEKNASEFLARRDRSIVKLPSGFAIKSALTLGAAGDLIQTEGIEHSKDILFSNVRDILFDKEISFANYESVVGHEDVVKKAIADTGSFTVCSTSDQYLAMVQHRGKYFTVLNTANNHALDLGLDGLENTQRLLEQNGIMNVGTPRNLEEYGRASILVSKGIKIGFVSATFGIRKFKLLPDDKHRIHVAKLNSKHVEPDLELLISQIADCKAQGCDFMVASLHWGWEFEFFPRQSQIETAHTLVEAGVDLILGHHPHVIQPVEYYRTRRDPNRIAVIAYSLGSTAFGWFTAPHLPLSLILNLELCMGSMNGSRHTYISAANAIPVFRHSFCDGHRHLMRLEKLDEHVAGNKSRSIRQMKEYADLVLGG